MIYSDQMTAYDPQRDSLAELYLFDPETAEFVLAGLEQLKVPVAPEDLGLLVDETILGLTHAVTFGRAVAGGLLSLIECADMTVVRRYCQQVRTAGKSGPTMEGASRHGSTFLFLRADLAAVDAAQIKGHAPHSATASPAGARFRWAWRRRLERTPGASSL